MDIFHKNRTDRWFVINYYLITFSINTTVNTCALSCLQSTYRNRRKKKKRAHFPNLMIHSFTVSVYISVLYYVSHLHVVMDIFFVIESASLLFTSSQKKTSRTNQTNRELCASKRPNEGKSNRHIATDDEGRAN